MSALAPKLGPLGLSPKTIGEAIAKETKAWAGLRVTCSLSVCNRVATIAVVPSNAALIIKALKEPSRDKKKVKHIKHDGDVTMEQIYECSRVMRPRSMARTFSGTVKEMLGTAVSVGCTVDGQDPREVQEQIDNGEIEPPSE